SARTGPRWAAASAAAGLFIGLALGAGYEFTGRGRPSDRGLTPGVIRPSAGITIGLPLPDMTTDDPVLTDLELALERPHTRELQAFDAFTPHVREIADRR